MHKDVSLQSIMDRASPLGPAWLVLVRLAPAWPTRAYAGSALSRTIGLGHAATDRRHLWAPSTDLRVVLSCLILLLCVNFPPRLC